LIQQTAEVQARTVTAALAKPEMLTQTLIVTDMSARVAQLSQLQTVTEAEATQAKSQSKKELPVKQAVMAKAERTAQKIDLQDQIKLSIVHPKVTLVKADKKQSVEPYISTIMQARPESEIALAVPCLDIPHAFESSVSEVVTTDVVTDPITELLTFRDLSETQQDAVADNSYVYENISQLVEVAHVVEAVPITEQITVPAIIAECNIGTQLEGRLQQLEILEIAVVTEMVRGIALEVGRLQEVRSTVDSLDDIEPFNRAIETLCVELMEYLHIESDAQQIQDIIKSILRIVTDEDTAGSQCHLPDAHMPPNDILGMHESKYYGDLSMSRVQAQIRRAKGYLWPPHILGVIGKITLRHFYAQ
jgi:hypothetical protein